MLTLEKMYNSIPIGKENAISKERLQKMWGLTNERSVRHAIAELRKMDNGDNFVIVSLSSCKGFYRTDDPEEILKYKKETLNRAKHTFAPLGKVNRILREDDTQLKITMLNRLKEAREEAGYKANEVIPIIKKYDPSFDKSMMSKIENNKCNPTNLQLSVMASLYKKTTAELTGTEIVL